MQQRIVQEGVITEVEVPEAWIDLGRAIGAGAVDDGAQLAISPRALLVALRLFALHHQHWLAQPVVVTSPNGQPSISTGAEAPLRVGA